MGKSTNNNSGPQLQLRTKGHTQNLDRSRGRGGDVPIRAKFSAAVWKNAGFPSSPQGLRPLPGSQKPLLGSHTPQTKGNLLLPQSGDCLSTQVLFLIVSIYWAHIRDCLGNRMLYFFTSLQLKEYQREKIGRGSSGGQISNSVPAENCSRSHC